MGINCTYKINLGSCVLFVQENSGGIVCMDQFKVVRKLS